MIARLLATIVQAETKEARDSLSQKVWLLVFTIWNSTNWECLIHFIIESIYEHGFLFFIIIQYLAFLHSATSDTEQICLKLLGEKFSEPIERLRLATAQVFASKPDHIEW